MTSIIIPSLQKLMTWLLLIIIISFAIGGIIMVFDGRDYPYLNENSHQILIPSEGVDKTHIILDVDAGSINITSGSGPELLQGIVHSIGRNPPGLSETTVNRTKNIVRKRAHGIMHDFISSEENWDISIQNSTDTSLLLSLGNGYINLSPGDARITELGIECGAGSAFINLSSWHGKNLPVRIDGGIGDITVLFPEKSYVAVAMEHCIGKLKITGFEGDEKRYYHRVQAADAPVIEVSISQGMGDLTLKTVGET